MILYDIYLYYDIIIMILFIIYEFDLFITIIIVGSLDSRYLVGLLINFVTFKINATMKLNIAHT